MNYTLDNKTGKSAEGITKQYLVTCDHGLHDYQNVDIPKSSPALMYVHRCHYKV